MHFPLLPDIQVDELPFPSCHRTTARILSRRKPWGSLRQGIFGDMAPEQKLFATKC